LVTKTPGENVIILQNEILSTQTYAAYGCKEDGNIRCIDVSIHKPRSFSVIWLNIEQLGRFVVLKIDFDKGDNYA